MIFKDGWTALIAACKEGHYEVVKELLECGAKIQLPDLVNIWIKIFLEIKVRYVIISISIMLKINNNTGIMNRHVQSQIYMYNHTWPAFVNRIIFCDTCL